MPNIEKSYLFWFLVLDEIIYADLQNNLPNLAIIIFVKSPDPRPIILSTREIARERIMGGC